MANPIAGSAEPKPWVAGHIGKPPPVYTIRREDSRGSADQGTPTAFACLHTLENDIFDSIDIIEHRMAKSLHVRNLDADLIRRLKQRAARHGRSTEAEHREILRQALSEEGEISFEELAARLRKLAEDQHHTPSEILQREGRDER